LPETPSKSAVMVAKCLSGAACRYHGCAVPPRRVLLARLSASHHIIFFCPEEASGLPTPRPPSRWREGRLMAAGIDVTATFQHGAELALALAKQNGIKKFYGLRWSPSCDPRTGMTSRLLRRHRIKCFYG